MAILWLVLAIASITAFCLYYRDYVIRGQIGFTGWILLGLAAFFIRACLIAWLG
jgi:hypothetical protein